MKTDLTSETIRLNHVGTIAVMDYIDSYPNIRCDCTMFTDGFTALMVSEYEPNDIDVKCLEKGITKWHKLPNGWERSYSGGAYVCKKNDRWIIITE